LTILGLILLQLSFPPLLSFPVAIVIPTPAFAGVNSSGNPVGIQWESSAIVIPTPASAGVNSSGNPDQQCHSCETCPRETCPRESGERGAGIQTNNVIPGCNCHSHPCFRRGKLQWESRKIRGCRFLLPQE